MSSFCCNQTEPIELSSFLHSVTSRHMCTTQFLPNNAILARSHYVIANNLGTLAIGLYIPNPYCSPFAVNSKLYISHCLFSFTWVGMVGTFLLLETDSSCLFAEQSEKNECLLSPNAPINVMPHYPSYGIFDTESWGGGAIELSGY